MNPYDHHTFAVGVVDFDFRSETSDIVFMVLPLIKI